MARDVSPPTAASAPPPHLLAWGATTAVAAALAVWVPAVALVLVVLLAAVLAVWRQPAPVLGRRMAAATVVAAVAGPNLALPQAPEVFGYRVLLVLLLAGVCTHLAVGGALRWPRALTLPASLMGVWLAWSLASMAWAEEPVRALRWSLLLAMGMALSLMIPVAFATTARAIALLKVLGVVFVVVVLVSLMELRLGIRLPTSRLVDRSADTSFAATSFFGNENNLATYLTLTLPYFLTLPVVFRDIRLRVAGLAGGLTCLLLLLYTGSKSNLLATALLLVAMLVIVALDPRHRRRAVAMGAGAAVAAALVIVPAVMGVGPVKLPERALSKFSFSLLAEQVQSGQGSGAVRSNLLSDGLGLVRDSGGVGVGAGNADVHIASLANFPGVANLHNWWLEVVVNGGLVGLALYVCLYLFLMHRGVRGSRHDDPLARYLSIAGAAALAGFVVGCLGPSSVLAFAPMWITFGLCLVAVVLTSRPGTPVDPPEA